MRVSLKNGQMVVALSKPEIKKLTQAYDVAEVLSNLRPVTQEVTEAATDVMVGVKSILANCATDMETPVEAAVTD